MTKVALGNDNCLFNSYLTLSFMCSLTTMKSLWACYFLSFCHVFLSQRREKSTQQCVRFTERSWSGKLIKPDFLFGVCLLWIGLAFSTQSFFFCNELWQKFWELSKKRVQTNHLGLRHFILCPSLSAQCHWQFQTSCLIAKPLKCLNFCK